MTKKIKIKFLAAALLICTAGVISSCYYDYGIDPDSSNVVVTLYDNQYDFSTVHRYILDTAVNQIGGTVTTAYNNLINTTMITNLNSLGWTRIPNPTAADSTAADVVIVGSGITSSTYVVDYGDYWWYGGGYYWYYPPYYSYSYSYTTGTLIMAIADKKLKTADQLPIIWSGMLNGATGQTSSPSSIITSGINQAFSQSGYLAP